MRVRPGLLLQQIMRLKIAAIIVALILLVGIPRPSGPNQPNILVRQSDQIAEVLKRGQRFSCLLRDGVVIPGRLRVKTGVFIPYAKTVAQKIEKIRLKDESKDSKKLIEALRQEKRTLEKLCAEAVGIPSVPTSTATPFGAATATATPVDPAPTNTPLAPTPTNTPVPPTPTSTPFLIGGDVLTSHLARPISSPSDPAFTGMVLGGDDSPVLFSFNPVPGEVERYVAVVAYGKLLELASGKNADGKIQTTRTFRQLFTTGSVCFYGYVLKNENTRTKFVKHASFGFVDCRHGES